MIVLAATFVAEPALPPLRLLLEVLGLTQPVVLAPYHQVFQQLLTPASLLRANVAGHSLVLLRLQDFLREDARAAAGGEADADASADGEDLAGRLAALVDQLVAAAAQAVQGLPGRLTMVVLPVTPVPGDAQAQALQQATTDLGVQLASVPGLVVLDAAPALAVLVHQGHDPARDQVAHLPYTETAFAVLARLLARRIHAVSRPPQKVLVLDCDHTLWHGVVGEDGPAGVAVPAGCAALQRFAASLVRQGVLVCLASKNVEADVLAVFDHHPQMPLRLADVVAHRVNWLPKPDNLRSLASELNLGLDAFVFLDDNPVECAAMRAALPQVMTLQVPAEPEMAAWLEALWMFDRTTVTLEDAQRTRMYRENASRKALEQQAVSIADFLAQLDLQIGIAPPQDGAWDRLAQLTQRTNQFNFTTRRRSEAELRALQAAGDLVSAVHVRDRFGDYGLVGLMVSRVQGQRWTVDTFLLSCRVLGRGVEHTMITALAAAAQAAGCQLLRLEWLATARNEPARAFLEAVAGAHAVACAEPPGFRFDVPVSEAAAIRHRPGEDPAAVMAALAAEQAAPVNPANAVSAPPADRGAAYARLARELGTPVDLLRAVRAQSRLERALPGVAVAPQSDDEATMLGLWSDVLNVGGLGMEDDFFALGGTSLASVSLFLDIERHYGVRCPLTTILQASTPRALCRHLAAQASVQSARVVELRRGGPQAVWLVHDGLGETLLYHHLARRFPAAFAVYGIEPSVQPGIPLAHASIEAMARDYVAQVRAIQPHGPYLLGGTCAGGLIAYQMAVELGALGETVQRVVILDGATPQARKRRGRVQAQRLARVRDLLTGHPTARLPAAALPSATLAATGTLTLGQAASPPLRVAQVAAKALNLVRYEAGRLWHARQVRRRFRVLCQVLQQAQPWPARLAPLRFSEIYGELELRYVPPRSAHLPVLLVRAGTGLYQADTPYREVYQEADLGWSRVVSQFEVLDVPGGHVSMLNAESVDALWQPLAGQLWPDRSDPSRHPPGAAS